MELPNTLPENVNAFSFNSGVGVESYMVYDFLGDKEEDADILSFLEDFWSARLRLTTYDSWLQLLPTNSQDPLYLRARNTVQRLKASQFTRLMNISRTQHWKKINMYRIFADILRTSPYEYSAKFNRSLLYVPEEAKGSKSFKKKSFKIYNYRKINRYEERAKFLTQLLQSYNVLTPEDLARISQNMYELKDEPTAKLPTSLRTFLYKDTRYHPWYHEEIQLPTTIFTDELDFDSQLTNTMLQYWDEFAPSLPKSVHLVGSHTDLLNRKGLYKNIDVPTKTISKKSKRKIIERTNSKTTTNAFESFSDYIASGMLQYDASKYDDGYYGSRKQLLYSNDLTTVEKIRQKIKDERAQKKKERFNKAFNIQDEKPTRRK